MAGIVYDLIDVLADQKTCYEGLYTLATYKTEAITNKNIELLTEIVEREEAFIGRVGSLEHKRENVLRDIALVTALEYKTLTLTILVEKMGKDLEVSQKLIAIREELLEIVEKVKIQNDMNRKLLDQSMEFVEFTLNAIKTTRLTETPINYNKPGNNQETRAVSFFDQKQ